MAAEKDEATGHYRRNFGSSAIDVDEGWTEVEFGLWAVDDKERKPPENAVRSPVPVDSSECLGQRDPVHPVRDDG